MSNTKSFSISKYYIPWITRYLELRPPELSEANWICRGLKNLVDCDLKNQIVDIPILREKIKNATSDDKEKFQRYLESALHEVISNE